MSDTEQKLKKAKVAMRGLKIKADVLSMARKISAFTGISISEIVTETLREPLTQRLRQVLAEENLLLPK